MNESMLNLLAFNEKTEALNAIVDTPKGSRNKFKFDEAIGRFKLAELRPPGNSFPFDFWVHFLQLSVKVDVLILMDEPGFQRLPRAQ